MSLLLPSLTSPNASRVDVPLITEAVASNPQAKEVVTMWIEHSAHCAATELQLSQLQCIAADQKKSLEEYNAGEAQVAELEEALEERTDELQAAQVKVRGLERDCEQVEQWLLRASQEKRATDAELKRLKASLGSSERSNGLLKRRLEAFGQGASTAFGLSCQGLKLRSLDLAACCVQVHNATNMDVSLAGWTVRVVGESHLVSEAGMGGGVGEGDQPDGVVVVSSPKRQGSRGARSRRDSLVAKRHAFYFPFDFMLAAGSTATIRWSPTQADYGDTNQFHWQRPEDFDASDVVHVAMAGDGGESRSEVLDDGMGYDEDNNNNGGGGGVVNGGGGGFGESLGMNTAFAVSKGPGGGVTGLGSFPGAAPSAHTNAAASLGGWNSNPSSLQVEGSQRRRQKIEAGEDDQADPDAPLRQGSMCLVDPNGVLTHTLPLLMPTPGDSSSRRAPRQLTAAALMGGFCGGGGGGGGGGSSSSFGRGGGFCAGNGSASSYNGDQQQRPQQQQQQHQQQQEQQQPQHQQHQSRDIGDEVADMAAEGFWSSTAAAALATPRRLGERFTAATENHNSDGGAKPPPSGRRWGPGGRNLQATPLPEPAVPDGCGLM